MLSELNMGVVRMRTNTHPPQNRHLEKLKLRVIEAGPDVVPGGTLNNRALRSEKHSARVILVPAELLLTVSAKQMLPKAILPVMLAQMWVTRASSRKASLVARHTATSPKEL